MKHLGEKKTEYDFKEPSIQILDTFENRYPDREYEIKIEFPELTSLCPVTGQPDFGFIRIHYIPRNKCVETKSLKLYMFAFRNYRSFMEDIVNKIHDDLLTVMRPMKLEVTGEFNPRGGTYMKVSVESYHEGYLK